MLRTRFTAAFGCEHPVLCVAGSAERVAAAADAGCLAILCAAAQPTVARLAGAVARTRELTDRPFGVSVGPRAGELEVVFEAGLKIIEDAGADRSGVLAHDLTVLGRGATLDRAVAAAGSGAVAVAVEPVDLVPVAADALPVPVVAAGGIADARALVSAFALGADGVELHADVVPTPERLRRLVDEAEALIHDRLASLAVCDYVMR